VVVVVAAAITSSCRGPVVDPPDPVREQLGAALSGGCSASVMNLVAHEDDDLLFISPDLANAIGRAGTCLRTVFLTAGDDGQDQAYWAGRESGIRAAYAQMAGVANAWTQADAGLSGRTVPLFTLSGNPAISVVFMRLPDGLTDGSGFESDGFESLQKLWEGSIDVIHAIDGSTSYDKPGLTAALASLIASFQPSEIRTQDFVGTFGDGDHSDHHTAAYFAQVAHGQYQGPHTFTGYGDYNIQTLPENVSGQDLTAKWNAFLAYAPFDDRVCQSQSDCENSGYGAFMPRQYTRSTEQGGGGSGGSGGSSETADAPEANAALTAVASASSETPAFGQTAAKAIDGVVGGYPGDYTKEWATSGGRAGSWLRLTWAAPVTLSRIVLHDRPNVNDQITSATLTFSDGSTVTVGALPNDGSSLAIALPSIATTTVLLTITGVSATTANIGLSEIEAWTATVPAPPANDPPAADAGTTVGAPDAADAGTTNGAPDAADGSEANLARTATATASSETPAYGQTAAKAIDGVVDGYPGDYTKEWATLGGGAGSWVKLSWPQAVTLSRIVLHDRPNTNDWITSAVLQLSDGSTINVDALPNDGSPLTVPLPSVSTTSVQLTVLSVAPTTFNIGLAEIEAWGP
jgi:LmbE family N-acetylglucosaminyl deacetylase